LYTVLPRLVEFIDYLSLWYLRFNKSRLLGDRGEEEAQHALATLYEVLFALCSLMAPFTPFIVESMYLNLKYALPKEQQVDSIHYLYIPEVDENQRDEVIERQVDALRVVIDLGRQARQKANISFRTPVPKVVVASTSNQFLSDVKSLESYVKSQLNVKEVEYSSEVTKLAHFEATPNHKSLGQRLKGDSKAATEFIKTMTFDTAQSLEEKGELSVTINNKAITLLKEDLATHEWKFSGDPTQWNCQGRQGAVILLRTVLDQECQDEGAAREFISRVQQLRKEAKITSEDAVKVYVDTTEPELARILKNYHDFIVKKIRVDVNTFDKRESTASILIQKKEKIYDWNLELCLVSAGKVKRT